MFVLHFFIIFWNFVPTYKALLGIARFLISEKPATYIHCFQVTNIKNNSTYMPLLITYTFIRATRLFGTLENIHTRGHSTQVANRDLFRGS